MQAALSALRWAFVFFSLQEASVCGVWCFTLQSQTKQGVRFRNVEDEVSKHSGVTPKPFFKRTIQKVNVIYQRAQRTW